ncbi:tol-pal system protein YbgF [Ochrobactrum teleogrylli]|uniref:Cell division coordinator CpoB n=1 Tax=Ochrobactrum teleogrylli TaxID=2479765 RepID=A0ABY2Y1N4_9HYPH|nr:tol-pal system protein YbgF [[Ochrobactrum] teleogrylli]TNV13223.1 tol-pal system protein YbgF [[Ochrobactrum] teleogrylli]
MRTTMRKVTLAIAMLPLLASAPVLAQTGDPGANQYSQQVCNLAHQNAQSYSKILQLRDRIVKIHRDNEARFQALEKGKGGGQNRVSVGSTAILDDAMRGGGASAQNGGYQSPGMLQELVRNLTGKIEDVDAQIAFTDNQLQKTQEDNEFRFEELEKKNGITSPASSVAGQSAAAAPAPGADLCAQGGGDAVSMADTLGMRAEAMNFQILEMQDQMQKMQEEYEQRFQFLETGKRAETGERLGNGGGSSDGSALASSGAAGNPDAGVSASAGQDGSISDRTPALDAPQTAQSGAVGADSLATGTTGSGAMAQGGPQRGEPPQTLGSIRFDSSGNVIGDSLSATPRPVEQGGLPAGQSSAGNGGAQDGTAVASLPMGDNPNTLYQASYQYLMSGDYKAAESGFRQHVKRYPADPQTAEARFWLGESLYGQGRYPEAATVFIDTQRDYPDSRRAPENMFKLGMTLEKMDNHDVACATFEQIPQRYPKAAPAILKRVAEERTRVKC